MNTENLITFAQFREEVQKSCQKLDNADLLVLKNLKNRDVVDVAYIYETFKNTPDCRFQINVTSKYNEQISGSNEHFFSMKEELAIATFCDVVGQINFMMMFLSFSVAEPRIDLFDFIENYGIVKVTEIKRLKDLHVHIN